MKKKLIVNRSGKARTYIARYVLKKTGKIIVMALMITEFLLSFSFPAYADWESGDVEHGPGVERTKWSRDDRGWRATAASGEEFQNAWAEIGGHWYYFGEDGYALSGWQAIDRKYYYFYPEENTAGHPGLSMAESTSIDGYEINADGSWNASGGEYWQAYAVLNEIGQELSKAFYWSANMPYLRMTTDIGLGERFFADYGFTNQTGNCYVMAATFHEMAQQLGYDSRMMVGMVPTSRGSLTPHSWVEIFMDGQTYVCDPDYFYNKKRGGYMFHYGDPGTWRYQNYSVMAE